MGSYTTLMNYSSVRGASLGCDVVLAGEQRMCAGRGECGRQLLGGARDNPAAAGTGGSVCLGATAARPLPAEEDSGSRDTGRSGGVIPHGTPHADGAGAARDSARSLERILPKLREVADQLVIGVDSASKDDSPEVAKPFADRVVSFPHEEIIPDTGSTGPGVDEYVLPHCRGDWILRVDHDETPGPEWLDAGLMESILSERRVTHIRVPKRWAVGEGDKYISNRHWHPDANVRLFRNIASILRMPRNWHETN